MQSNRHRVTRTSSAGAATATAVSAAQSTAASTDLYDLWLNSRLPTVSPSMVTGVTSSSSHQLDRCSGRGVDSERLAEKLMQLGCSEMAREAVEERL